MQAMLVTLHFDDGDITLIGPASEMPKGDIHSITFSDPHEVSGQFLRDLVNTRQAGQPLN